MEDAMGFIRKVFGIIAVQMVWTFFCAASGALFKQRIDHVVRNPGMILLMLIGLIVSSLWLVWSEEARRSVPKNYILLGVFTFCEGFFFAGLTSRMDIQAVLMASSALAVITSSLFIMVWNLKDFHLFHRAVFKCMFYSIFIQLGLLITMIYMSIYKYSGQEIQFYFSLVMVVVGCIYLCFDLLIIIMPKGISHEDYILAALLLYMDIAQLFWNLLILFSKKDG